jgi:hypothetical protein
VLSLSLGLSLGLGLGLLVLLPVLLRQLGRGGLKEEKLLRQLSSSAPSAWMTFLSPWQPAVAMCSAGLAYMM